MWRCGEELGRRMELQIKEELRSTEETMKMIVDEIRMSRRCWEERRRR